MKRFKTRRNRKHIDLVELVRNRFRFQPYRFHSNANISSRSSTRIVPSVRSSRFASTENLPKNQRLRLGHSKRTGVVTRSAAEGEPHPSGSIGVSPPCSSRQMHRDETSQTSIPKELRHLLLDDTKHSDEDDGSTTAAEASGEAEENSSNTNTENPTSNNSVTEQQDVNESESCSNEERASASLSAAVQAMVDSDPDETDELDETEETEDTEDPRETEDGEDTEDTEVAHDTVSGHEHVSDLDHFLHEHRSQVLPQEEGPADEEAGGDGHHNNSVIEIEITLTSGNDSNSNSEEDENDTDAIGDDGSDDI